MCAKLQQPPHSLEETQRAGQGLAPPPVPVSGAWTAQTGLRGWNFLQHWGGPSRPGTLALQEGRSVPETGMNKAPFVQGRERRGQHAEAGLETAGKICRHLGRVQGQSYRPGGRAHSCWGASGPDGGGAETPPRWRGRGCPPTSPGGKRPPLLGCQWPGRGGGLKLPPDGVAGVVHPQWCPWLCLYSECTRSREEGWAGASALQTPPPAERVAGGGCETWLPGVGSGEGSQL